MRTHDHSESIKKIENVLGDHGLPCPLSFINKQTGINYTTLKMLITEALGYSLVKETIPMRRKALVVR